MKRSSHVISQSNASGSCPYDGLLRTGSKWWFLPESSIAHEKMTIFANIFYDSIVLSLLILYGSIEKQVHLGFISKNSVRLAFFQDISIALCLVSKAKHYTKCSRMAPAIRKRMFGKYPAPLDRIL